MRLQNAAASGDENAVDTTTLNIAAIGLKV
jgi:hypothetical protein